MDYKLSLYQAVEVEIGGQKYPFRKRDRKLFRELSEFEKKEAEAKTNQEKIDISYESLRLFIDAPQEVFDGLNVEEVTELRKIIDMETQKTLAIVKPVEDDPGKNAPKPGEGTAV